jgi:hypothetical protein
MGIQISHVPDTQILQLVDQLDSVGFASIPNYVHADDLARMRQFIGAAMKKSGNEYIGFGGPEEVAGSGLEDFYVSPAFSGLIKRVYEQGTGRRAPEQELYHVLRCLCGKTGQKHAWMFHYDSYVVTALIPIQIPTDGQTGDLLMFPNTRSIRPAYLFNALDKVLLDNALTQKLLRASVEKRRLKPVRIRMQPGNLYLFWGYRTIHTNEPCDVDQVRATALFHFANPHRKPGTRSEHISLPPKASVPTGSGGDSPRTAAMRKML